MHNFKTRKELENYRFGKWAGKPEGYAYNSHQCAYEVYPSTGWVSYQCTRKPKADLYCKQHAKMVRG